jgi:hypothetical protein
MDMEMEYQHPKLKVATGISTQKLGSLDEATICSFSTDFGLSAELSSTDLLPDPGTSHCVDRFKTASGANGKFDFDGAFLLSNEKRTEPDVVYPLPPIGRRRYQRRNSVTADILISQMKQSVDGVQKLHHFLTENMDGEAKSRTYPANSAMMPKLTSKVNLFEAKTPHDVSSINGTADIRNDLFHLNERSISNGQKRTRLTDEPSVQKRRRYQRRNSVTADILLAQMQKQRGHTIVERA